MDRVVVLVDMDCFYVQVEERLQPEYQGKPCAVAQYNPWQGGGIIAVNYEARSFGVTRGMRGNDAKRKCPNLHLFYVPEVRGKADLTRYREAGAEVLEILSQFCDCVERASIDEAYLDMTAIAESKVETIVTADKLPQTFVVGWEEQKGTSISQWIKSTYENGNMPDKKLAIVATLVEEMRAAVFASTKFHCSAGIAHNKMLAKLACGLHKPNRQTVVPHTSVPELYTTTPVHKLRNLGGKLGEEVKEKLGIETMSELAMCSERKLRQEFGDKTGLWLFKLAQGIENEIVTSRQLPKSIGCGKNFLGKLALNSKEKVHHWLLKLAEELEERLNRDQHDNNRFAKALTVHLRYHCNSGHGSVSRGCQIKSYIASVIAHDAYKAIEKFNTAQPSSPLWIPHILNLSLTAARFQDHIDIGTSKIENYFGTNAKSPNKKIYEIQEESAKVLKQTFKSRNEESTKLLSFTSEKNLFKLQSETNNTEIGFFGECNVTCNGQSLLGRKVESISSNGNKPQTELRKGFFATKLQKLNSITRETLKTCDAISEKNASSLMPLSKNINNEDEKNIESFTNSKQTNNEKKCQDFKSTLRFDIKSSSISDLNSNFSELDNDKSTIKIPKELETKCKKCNLSIPVWELQEHEDYHFALSLEKSNIRQSQQNEPLIKTSEKTNKGARKRHYTKNNGTTKKLKGTTKTIEFFFKK